MISELPNRLGTVSRLEKGGSGSVSQVQGNEPVSAPAATGAGKETIRPVQSVAAEASSPPVDEQQLEQMVENLNEAVQAVHRQLQFNVDQESGKTIIRVVDAESKETIREIPSEEVLKMQKRLEQYGQTVLGSGGVGAILFQGEA